MNLNLYRIIFKTGGRAGSDDWTARFGTKPLGHATVLASDPEAAKQGWITDLVNRHTQKHPNQNIQSIIRTRWTDRWESTELIEGPFRNGFVICNGAITILKE